MYDRGHGMSQHPGLILKSLFYRFYSDYFSLPQRRRKLKQDEYYARSLTSIAS